MVTVILTPMNFLEAFEFFIGKNTAGLRGIRILDEKIIWLPQVSLI